MSQANTAHWASAGWSASSRSAQSPTRSGELVQIAFLGLLPPVAIAIAVTLPVVVVDRLIQRCGAVRCRAIGVAAGDTRFDVGAPPRAGATLPDLPRVFAPHTTERRLAVGLGAILMATAALAAHIGIAIAAAGPTRRLLGA